MKLNTPTDALEYKSAAISAWRKMKPLVGQYADVPSLSNWHDDLGLMHDAVPTIWPNHFAALAITASAQLRESGLRYSLPIPPLNGRWHMWAEPIMEITTSDGVLLPINSLLIRPIRYAENSNRPALAFRAYADDVMGVHSVLWMNLWLDLASDEAVADMLSPFTAKRDRLEAIKVFHWFVASEQFLNQKLLVSERAHTERHARKRAERDQISPEVHVVRLREVIRTHPAQSEREAIEYTCRWMVRGHWQNHWFPSRGKHEPIWIMPYVKGPKDKPFRAPLPAVAAVVR